MFSLKKIKRLFLDTLFPPICVSCRKKTAPDTGDFTYLCFNCFLEIPRLNGVFCPTCRQRLGSKLNCHRERFQLMAVSSYHHPAVKSLILALKYQRARLALNPWPSLVRDYLKTAGGYLAGFQNALIIPVPLHPKRQRERGFNQSELIANILAEEINKIYPNQECHVLTGNLVKIRRSQPQAGLNFSDRQKNITDCFKVKKADFIKGRKVIVVDDVFTSGATMKEIIKTINKAGASKTAGFVLAKTD